MAPFDRATPGGQRRKRGPALRTCRAQVWDATHFASVGDSFGGWKVTGLPWSGFSWSKGLRRLAESKHDIGSTSIIQPRPTATAHAVADCWSRDFRNRLLSVEVFSSTSGQWKHSAHRKKNILNFLGASRRRKPFLAPCHTDSAP